MMLLTTEDHQAPLLADLARLEQHLEHIFATLGHAAHWRELRGWAAAAQRDLASLERHCTGLTPEAARLRVRMVSHLFFATNVAEQAHRIRRRQWYRQPDGQPQPGSLRDVFARLQQAGVRAPQIVHAWQQLRLTSVLTAHPTEPSRRTLLRKEARLLHHLLDDAAQRGGMRRGFGPGEAIERELTLAWQTDELPHAPTVAQEAEHVIYHLSHVLYDVVPAVSEGMADAFAHVFGHTPEETVLARPVLHFGSWVGGDMDGNPNVGAQTIVDSLAAARRAVVDNYRRDCTRLLDHLSQSRQHGITTTRTDRQLEYARKICGDISLPARHATMPYRQLLHLMLARLDGIGHKADVAYVHAAELLADVRALRNDVFDSAPGLMVERPLTRLMRRIETFGLHLATLDVRQDALVHRQAAAAYLQEPAFVDWPVYRRTERLAAALRQPARAHDVEDAGSIEPLPRSLQVMAAIARARAQLGVEVIGPYIISMAQDIDDVLAVLLLGHASGLHDEDGNVALDVSPLFETVPDLQRAGATLAAMLEHPQYRAHLRARGDVQHVMLGYSDSNKASGIVASRWALQQGQRMLTAVAQNFGVRLVLFYGRGGTASRGGSRPREAIFALPPGVVQGELRETVQGETIHHNFGHEQLALRSLELLGGAVLEALAPQRTEPTPERYLAAMATCAGLSAQAYQQLVGHPDFFAFFTAATPIDAIGKLSIGSRPSARRAQKSLGDLRAIPWVFSWTQCRLLVPNWFGIGAGLKAMRQEYGDDTVVAMRKHWPYFRTLLRDAAIGLSTVDLQIAQIYVGLAGQAAQQLWPMLQAAYQQAVDEVLLAQQSHSLLDDEPMVQRALARRNPWVRPLHLMQVDLLARWRSTERKDLQLQEALLMSVKGIARGLLATG